MFILYPSECVWKSEGDLWKLVLPFPLRGTWVVKPGRGVFTSKTISLARKLCFIENKYTFLSLGMPR